MKNEHLIQYLARTLERINKLLKTHVRFDIKIDEAEVIISGLSNANLPQSDLALLRLSLSKVVKTTLLDFKTEVTGSFEHYIGIKFDKKSVKWVNKETSDYNALIKPWPFDSRSLDGSLPRITDKLVGRDLLLSQLANSFAQKKKTREPTVVLCTGSLGIGKTLLALSHAHNTAKLYQYKLIFPAATKELLITWYYHFAVKHKLISDTENYHPDEVVDLVLRWFARHSNWLVIYDGVIDYQDISAWLPKEGEGDMLITSRMHASTWTGSKAITLDVPSLEPHAAAQMIGSLLRVADDPLIPNLARILGYLPEALYNACCYIGAEHLTLSQYMELIATQPWFKITQKLHYDSFSFDVEQHAQSLLKVCLFFNSQHIPYGLLKNWYRYCNPKARNIEFLLQRMLDYLYRYSFIALDTQKRVIEINPGLQCLLQTSISLKEQSQILNQLSDWFLRGYTAWRLSEIGGSDCHLPQALTTLIFDYDFGYQPALKLSQEEICIETLAWKTLGSSLVPHLQSVIAHCNKFEISVLKLQPLPAEFVTMDAKSSQLKNNRVNNETIPRLARSGFVASSGDDPGDEPGKGSTTCCVDDDRTRDVLQIARIGRNRYGFVNSRLSKQKAHEISSAPSKVLAKQGNLNFLSDAPGLQISGLGC